MRFCVGVSRDEGLRLKEAFLGWEVLEREREKGFLGAFASSGGGGIVDAWGFLLARNDNGIQVEACGLLLWKQKLE